MHDTLPSNHIDIPLLYQPGRNPSRAALEAQKLQAKAEEEKRLAEAAAKDSETIKYLPGQKPKEPRNEDPQERTNSIRTLIANDVAANDKLFTKVLNAIPQHQPETPTKKRNRKYMDVNALIKQNLEERLMRVQMNMDTSDLDKKLRELEDKRSEVHEKKRV